MNQGKKYSWSGSPIVLAADDDYYVVNSGGSLVFNGTTAPVDNAADDWIVSDDLSGYRHCALQLKITKTAGPDPDETPYTTAPAGLTGMCLLMKGVMSLDELDGQVQSNWDGTEANIKTNVWGQMDASVQNGIVRMSGNNLQFMQLLINEFGHAWFGLFSNSVDGLIVPLRYVAVAIKIDAGANISEHEFQMEAQWVYA